MPHADPDLLVAIALGEASDAAVAGHLGVCGRCRTELAALRRAVAAGAAGDPAPPGALLEPPPTVWEGISAGLRPGRGSAPPRGTGTGIGARPGSPAPPSARPARARRRLALAVCAAVLGAAAGSGVTVWATAQDGGTAEQAPGPARALQALMPAAAGSARLEEDRGARRLAVSVRGLPATSGYFEVWLMDRSHSKLISLGVLGPDGHAVLPLPATVDVSAYPVVDVSVQPYNGRPDHSGDSVVRGPYGG
ncbi:anti-sigma factor domain-containing protein [Streptomyces sp. NPDC007904]|uniref:anti-sigma factor n=1 Tax=Streptomyces sp. NPDC007904 TaxID=3364787 RepID=UPI0036E7197C